MKKTLCVLVALILLNGCAETLALLGPATSSAGSGKAAHSALSSAVSYGIKQQTGKSPSQHALTFVKKHNAENKKETCTSFIEKTNSEICTLLKKQIHLTRDRIFKNKKNDELLENSSQSLQTKINKKSQIKYLD